jgi:hypothetical protein
VQRLLRLGLQPGQLRGKRRLRGKDSKVARSRRCAGPRRVGVGVGVDVEVEDSCEALEAAPLGIELEHELGVLHV